MMKSFTRDNVLAAQKAIENALKEHLGLENVGVKLPGGCRFTPQSMTTKVELFIRGENGENNSKSVCDFKLHAPLRGIPADALNKTISLRSGASNRQFKIVGWNARRHKFPIEAIRVDNGKRYKLAVISVKNALTSVD